MLEIWIFNQLMIIIYIYTHDWNHIPVYIGFIHLNVEFARRYFTENEIGYIVRI